MSASIRSIACTLAALAGAIATLDVQAQSHRRAEGYRTMPVGGWHAPGRAWRPVHGRHFHSHRGGHRPSVAIGVGVGLGLGLGFGLGTHGHIHSTQVYPAPVWPRYGDPSGAVLAVPVMPLIAAEPPLPSPPEPVIYPNHQQTAAQTESDRRECNRWALTQPQAAAVASVFHRATTACMEGRGYTVR